PEGSDQDAELREKLFQTVARINNLLIRHGNSERLAGGFGLSQQQWGLLVALARAGDSGMSMSQLGNNLLVTKANMTGMIDRLEREEYVVRKHHNLDRRVIRLELTEKGKSFIKEIEGPRDHFTAEMFSEFSDADRRQFFEYLNRLHNRLNNA
ncbi:MAG: MarR family winged helix-turn-helix transcriptional regulator, partial [Tumebacillaceae bacterium]